MMSSIRRWWTEIAPIMRSMPWTLKLLWRSHWQSTLAIAVLTLLQGGVPAIQLWITKLLVDQILLTISTAAGQRTEQMITMVFIYLGLEALTLLVGVLIGVLSGYFYNVLGEHLTYHVQSRILEQCTSLDLAAYESSTYYNQLQQAQEQAEDAPMLLLRRLLEFAQTFVSLLAVFALVFLYKPWIALIPIVTTIPGFLIAIYYGRQHFFLYDSRTPLGRRAIYLERVLSTDTYAKEVRIWGITDYLLGMWRSLRLRFKHENIQLSRRQSVASFFGELLSTAGYYGAYTVIILGVLAQELTIGDLTLYAGAFSRLQSLFDSLLQAIANVYETQLFVQRLEQFLNLKPQITTPPAPQPLPDFTTGIRVKNLSFTYPETEEQVLDQLDFTIRPGQCVAIVGANGSGKTTLVKLLLRLYEPTEGEIYLDDTDIRQIDLDQLRKSMAVVFQDYARYQLTVRENIGFGKIDMIEDCDRIQAVAREAGIDSLIERLPEAYETVLGRLFEGGHELSLGQWQRVAVARALLRDAPILIMDEPTAAMDAQSEYDLYQQLKKLAQGRITILISHRFSTVRMADHIFVLEDGRIIEEGTHAELLAQDTRYAYYFNLQAESYQIDSAPTHLYHSNHDEQLPSPACP